MDSFVLRSTLHPSSFDDTGRFEDSFDDSFEDSFNDRFVNG